METVSELLYTPKNERDFGTLACWAKNSIGKQTEPCLFQVVPAGKYHLPRLFAPACQHIIIESRHLHMSSYYTVVNRKTLEDSSWSPLLIAKSKFTLLSPTAKPAPLRNCTLRPFLQTYLLASGGNGTMPSAQPPPAGISPTAMASAALNNNYPNVNMGSYQQPSSNHAAGELVSSAARASSTRNEIRSNTNGNNNNNRSGGKGHSKNKGHLKGKNQRQELRSKRNVHVGPRGWNWEPEEDIKEEEEEDNERDLPTPTAEAAEVPQLSISRRHSSRGSSSVSRKSRQSRVINKTNLGGTLSNEEEEDATMVAVPSNEQDDNNNEAAAAADEDNIEERESEEAEDEDAGGLPSTTSNSYSNTGGWTSSSTKGGVEGGRKTLSTSKTPPAKNPITSTTTTTMTGSRRNRRKRRMNVNNGDISAGDGSSHEQEVDENEEQEGSRWR